MLNEMVMIPKSNQLEAHVGITSQRNTGGNMDPRTYRRWDQVRRRSKHPIDRSHPPWAPFQMLKLVVKHCVSSEVNKKSVVKHCVSSQLC
jgi:hypothetical protein